MDETRAEDEQTPTRPQLESSCNVHSVDIASQENCFSLQVHLFWVGVLETPFCTHNEYPVELTIPDILKIPY